MLMLPPPEPPLEDVEDLVMLMLPPPEPPSISKVVTFLVVVTSISISSWISFLFLIMHSAQYQTLELNREVIYFFAVKNSSGHQ